MEKGVICNKKSTTTKWWCSHFYSSGRGLLGLSMHCALVAVVVPYRWRVYVCALSSLLLQSTAWLRVRETEGEWGKENHSRKMLLLCFLYSTCCNEVVFRPVYVWCCFVCVTDASRIAVRTFVFVSFSPSSWSPFIVRRTLIRTYITPDTTRRQMCSVYHSNTTHMTYVEMECTKMENTSTSITLTAVSSHSAGQPILCRHPLFVCLKIS